MHLSEAELGAVLYDTYERASSCGREPKVAQGSGAVLILSRIGPRYAMADAPPHIRIPPNGCPIIAYLGRGCAQDLRVAGICFSPSGKPAEVQVTALTAKTSHVCERRFYSPTFA